MKNTTSRDLENDWEGWARTFLAQNHDFMIEKSVHYD